MHAAEVCIAYAGRDLKPLAPTAARRRAAGGADSAHMRALDGRLAARVAYVLLCGARMLVVSYSRQLPGFTLNPAQFSWAIFARGEVLY